MIVLYKSEYIVEDDILLESERIYWYDWESYVTNDAESLNIVCILDDKLFKNRTLEVYSVWYAELDILIEASELEILADVFVYVVVAKEFMKLYDVSAFELDNTELDSIKFKLDDKKPEKLSVKLDDRLDEYWVSNVGVELAVLKNTVFTLDVGWTNELGTL